MAALLDATAVVMTLDCDIDLTLRRLAAQAAGSWNCQESCVRAGLAITL
jgi:hypothetical protein